MMEDAHSLLDHVIGHLALWRKLRGGHWEYWAFCHHPPTFYRWMRLSCGYCAMVVGPWTDVDQSRPLRCENYCKETTDARS